MSSNFKKSYKHIQYLKIDKSHVKWVNIIIIILNNTFYKSKTDWDNDFNPFPATKHEKTAQHAPTRRVHDPTRVG